MAGHGQVNPTMAARLVGAAPGTVKVLVHCRAQLVRIGQDGEKAEQDFSRRAEDESNDGHDDLLCAEV